MIYLSKDELKKRKFLIDKNNFRLIFPPDVNISERQAQAIANTLRANGTALLKQARSLFLWNNLTNSILVIIIFIVLTKYLNYIVF